MNSFEIVASSTENTVVAEYTPEKRKSTDYQSEAELEKDFINRLTNQGYEYITISTDAAISAIQQHLHQFGNFFIHTQFLGISRKIIKILFVVFYISVNSLVENFVI